MKKILSGPVPYDLEEVVWDDAAVDSGWDKAKKPKAELVLSVGFVVKETEQHLVLAASICKGDFDTNCRLQVPKGMIIHRKVINGKV